jgi:hypothetical protein
VCSISGHHSQQVRRRGMWDVGVGEHMRQPSFVEVTEAVIAGASNGEGPEEWWLEGEYDIE